MSTTPAVGSEEIKLADRPYEVGEAAVALGPTREACSRQFAHTPVLEIAAHGVQHVGEREAQTRRNAIAAIFDSDSFVVRESETTTSSRRNSRGS